MEKIVNITPGVVRLTGSAQDEIKSTVTVVPVEKYEFSITGREVQTGKNINVDLKQLDGEKKSWQLLVVNKRKIIGRYFDVITLKTDSDIQPLLKIRVFGNIVNK